MGEPFLYGGQEKFLLNVLSKLDYTNKKVDIFTPYQKNNISGEEILKSLGVNLFAQNFTLSTYKESV